jgi:tetratricopeptide (TPR) repeat protein
LLAKSYVLQKDWIPAMPHIKKAEQILNSCKPDNQLWRSAMAEMLLVKANVLYFNSIDTRLLDACLEELQPLVEASDSETLRLHFYITILLSLLRRYQWYKFPPESVTHALFTLALARQLNDRPSEIVVLGVKAMIHMFRGEWNRALEANLECLELTQEKPGEQLPLTCNYLAVTYRMMGKPAECETWCRKALDYSLAQGNRSYEALSKSNLAWIYLLRNNLKYAEEYGRESFETLTAIRHPFLWLAVMPLVASLCAQHRVAECGEYLHALYLPLRKKLPEALDVHLKKAVQYWMADEIPDMQIALEQALYEAKLTGHL